MPMATTQRSCARSDGCCTPSGRFLYADYRTRRKMPRLEELARAAGLDGELRDITPNVVGACELDAERRRRMIRSGLPWYARLLLTRRLEGYSGLPGTLTFERFRGGDRMYFLTCMAPGDRQVDARPPAVPACSPPTS